MANILTHEDGEVKPFVKYGVIGIAVLVVGFFAYRVWAGGAGRTQDFEMICTTEGCGYVSDEKLKIGDVLPLTCPDCGKRSVVPAFRCPECEAINVWNESRGLPAPTPCVGCGYEVYHE